MNISFQITYDGKNKFDTNTLVRMGTEQITTLRDREIAQADKYKKYGMYGAGSATLVTTIAACIEGQSGTFSKGCALLFVGGALAYATFDSFMKNRKMTKNAKQLDQALVYLTNDPGKAYFDATIPDMYADGTYPRAQPV